MNTDEGKTLMRRFQENGDTKACRALFTLFRVPLWRFLLRLCGSEPDADDLSQRVWLRLIEIAERGAYRAPDSSSFRTYLFTIARNMFIDDTRALRSRTMHVDVTTLNHLPDSRIASMESMTNREGRKAVLRAAMRQLPFEQQEVLAMWAEGVGYDEIAVIVGAPRNTVIGRKRYGIEKLRASLGGNAGGLENENEL